MKQVTNMSRLVNQLEKTFRLLNEDWFEGKLPMPIITVYPCSRSYAHYTTANVWKTSNGGKREINIASGTLNRTLDEIIASLMHEMVHMYNDMILNVQDCSRGGTYHNMRFAIEAEKHGLIVEKSDKYGYAHTSCAEDLLDWIILHNELREIEICRINPMLGAVGIGGKASNGGASATSGSSSHSRKYQCPCCRNSVRATKEVRVICGDCLKPMLEN